MLLIKKKSFELNLFKVYKKLKCCSVVVEYKIMSKFMSILEENLMPQFLNKYLINNYLQYYIYLEYSIQSNNLVLLTKILL